MIDLGRMGNNALTVLIILLFFVFLFVKLRGRTLRETWDDIYSWVGK